MFAAIFLLPNLILVSVFSLQLMVPRLTDIVLESSAANTAYKYSNGWRRWRIGGANDPGFRSLDSSMKDRHVGWKNPKSKFRYLEAVPEQLIEITRSMSI